MSDCFRTCLARGFCFDCRYFFRYSRNFLRMSVNLLHKSRWLCLCVLNYQVWACCCLWNCQSERQKEDNEILAYSCYHVHLFLSHSLFLPLPLFLCVWCAWQVVVIVPIPRSCPARQRIEFGGTNERRKVDVPRLSLNTFCCDFDFDSAECFCFGSCDTWPGARQTIIAMRTKHQGPRPRTSTNTITVRLDQV